MRRPYVSLAIAFAAALALPAVRARAQGPSGPVLPVALDLKTVAIGSWSEYTVKIANLPPFKQRFALVGRDATTNALEMTAEGGMMAAGGKVTVKVVLGHDLSRSDRVKKVVMQLSNNTPMEMQAGAVVPKDQFTKLDPKKLVGKQDVLVPAGTFKAKHYRDRGVDGGTLELWVSEAAPPFGIVKMQGQVAQGPGTPSMPLVIELESTGRDARPQITRTAEPFDPAKLQAQVQRQMGGGGSGTSKAK